ncbi:histone H3 [Tubulinosema ratisbonensis]|uniref:Histone H3 n=1 Tax=Tubulinosema ratisbonensis TaxID=291195 RepID=A0A437ALY7_9MICR|nr:histone H3 [Tubulinosema ratisbonensis]
MARTALSGKKGKKTTKEKKKKEITRKSSSSTSVVTPKITESVKTKTSRQRKTKPNLVVKEVKFYQGSTNFLIARAPFVRMVKNMMHKESNAKIQRITATALEVIQEALESHLVGVYEKSYSCSAHAKRKTLFPKDIQLYRSLNDQ